MEQAVAELVGDAGAQVVGGWVREDLSFCVPATEVEHTRPARCPLPGRRLGLVDRLEELVVAGAVGEDEHSGLRQRDAVELTYRPVGVGEGPDYRVGPLVRFIVVDPEDNCLPLLDLMDVLGGQPLDDGEELGVVGRRLPLVPRAEVAQRREI